MMAEKDHRCTEPNHRAKLQSYDAKLRCKVKKREAKRRSYDAKSRSSNKTLHHNFVSLQLRIFATSYLCVTGMLLVVFISFQFLAVLGFLVG